MSKSILFHDATYLDLNKPSEFQKFFIGLIELLKKKLQQKNFGDSGHYYYACSEIHDRCNHNWKHMRNCQQRKSLVKWIIL